MLDTKRFVEAYNKHHIVRIKNTTKEKKVIQNEDENNDYWETEVEDVILIDEPLIF